MIRYILEATWRDRIGRNKKQSVIGVYANFEDIEKAKEKTAKEPHRYKSVTFNVQSEEHPFFA
jgi:predicted component of type VI protein secretion system